MMLEGFGLSNHLELDAVTNQYDMNNSHTNFNCSIHSLYITILLWETHIDSGRVKWNGKCWDVGRF